MHLDPDEPAAAAWRRLDHDGLRAEFERVLPASGRRSVLVDGRSGAGKTTAAERIARALDAAIVHTDDVAWNHSIFDWDDLVLEHVIAPWRAGAAFTYTPPGWLRHGRPGAIAVPATRTLVVEGVGACRASLAEHADVCVWVQSDRTAARESGIARDIANGRTPEQARKFWDGWMRAEDPFQAVSRPWTRARIIVRGTTALPLDPDHLHVADGPLG